MTKMDMFYEPDAGSQKRSTNLPASSSKKQKKGK
jgi:hypothetical protein